MNYPNARNSRLGTLPLAVIGRVQCPLGQSTHSTGCDSCYPGIMSKQKKPVVKNAKSGRFAVGTAGFGKISAVEGIRTTPAMKKRAGDARAKGLSAEEYRRTIIGSYRKD